MSQYFDNDNKLNSNIFTYKTMLLGIEFSFCTDNGVFSKNKLDFGSRVLIEKLPKFSSLDKILDVGCGYGPIGIAIAKKYSSIVDMVDVNNRALHLAKMNAKSNDVNVNIFESNIYDKVVSQYDYIITNPPIRAGKQVVYQFVMDANKYLKEQGTLFLVINKDQGAKSIIFDLNKIYNVDVIDKNKGFFVIKCQKKVDLLQ